MAMVSPVLVAQTISAFAMVSLLYPLTFYLFLLLFNTIVFAGMPTIRWIARVVQKFAFFFARRAGIRGVIGFEGIAAVSAFPTWHRNTSFVIY
jgi:hypothetical protein